MPYKTCHFKTRASIMRTIPHKFHFDKFIRTRRCEFRSFDFTWWTTFRFRWCICPFYVSVRRHTKPIHACSFSLSLKSCTRPMCCSWQFFPSLWDFGRLMQKWAAGLNVPLQFQCGIAGIAQSVQINFSLTIARPSSSIVDCTLVWGSCCHFLQH